MSELLVDFITSLDGYASAEGWPGFWGLQGPEYLAWLEEQPDVTYLMGANTYRLMSGFAAGETPAGQDEFNADEAASVDGLTQASKVVFSTSLEEPLTWANARLVGDDAVQAVRAMKADASGLMSTIGSISLSRSLLQAGLVDRLRVVMFPVITGATGAERIYDGYPDVALEMIDNRTFDGRIQLDEGRVNDMAATELQAIVRFRFHDGAVEEFKRLSAECMEIVRTKDTGTLQYDTYFNDDETECIVIERFRDSDALIDHGENLAHLMDAIIATGSVSGELLGNPSAELRARFASGDPVQLFTPWMAM